MAEPAGKRDLGTRRSMAGFEARAPREVASERAAAISRRRFLELGLGAVAGVAVAGCGGARRISRGPRERTSGEGEDRERGRGAGRGFGLGRLLRRLF